MRTHKMFKAVWGVKFPNLKDWLPSLRLKRDLSVTDKPCNLPEYQKYFSITRNVYGPTKDVSKQIFQPFKFEPFKYEFRKKNVLVSEKKLNLHSHLITKAPVKFCLDQLALIPTLSALTVRNCIQEALTPFFERGIPMDEIYVERCMTNRSLPIKSVRFQPYLRTRPVCKRVSHYVLYLSEGVPLPRDILRHPEIIRRRYKFANPLVIRRSEKPFPIVYHKKHYFSHRRRPIK